jgi:hypothetical protein
MRKEPYICRNVYEDGKLKECPGLVKEVTEICQVIGIPDVNNVVVSKHDVKKAISEHHYSDMINTVGGQTKLEDIKGDDFKRTQEYLYDRSVKKARMAFKIRTHMVPDIPGNFKNKYRVIFIDMMPFIEYNIRVIWV